MVGHWWSLPSDLFAFPAGLVKQPTALCPSCPHLKQWLQIAVPWAKHGWHFPFVAHLGGRTVLTELACGGSGVLVVGVRTFSIVFAKAETCAVSSWIVVRFAWTSALV